MAASNSRSAESRAPSPDGGNVRDTVEHASPPPDPSSSKQLEAFEQCIQDNGLTDHVKLLPGLDQRHFQTVQFTVGKSTIHHKMLFLGETEKFETFAYLKLFDNKGCEVHFIKHYLESGQWENNNTDAENLMYPYQFYVDKDKTYGVKQLLRTVISYIFLSSGQVSRVHKDDNPASAIGNLQKALTYLDASFEDLGLERNIVLTYEPGHKPETYDEDHAYKKVPKAKTKRKAKAKAIPAVPVEGADAPAISRHDSEAPLLNAVNELARDVSQLLSPAPNAESPAVQAAQRKRPREDEPAIEQLQTIQQKKKKVNDVYKSLQDLFQRLDDRKKRLHQDERKAKEKMSKKELLDYIEQLEAKKD